MNSEVTPLSRPEDALLRVETVALYVTRALQITLRGTLLNRPFTVPPYDFETMKAMLASPTVRLTIYNIESAAAVWGAHMPDSVQARAAVAGAIAQKYHLSRQAAPNTCAVLQVDNPAVQAAYRAIFQTDLNAVLSEPPPVDERPFWFRLKGLTEPQALKDLQDALEWVYVPSGEVLYREGERGDRMGVIVTGRMRASVDSPSGEDVLVELGRGAVVGELAALSHERRRTATVYAIRDSELIEITGQGLQQLATRHPQIGFAIMQEVVNKMRRTLVAPRSSSELSTIAVVPVRPDVPLRQFTKRLAESLCAHETAFLLDSATFDAALGPGASAVPESDSRNSELIVWLTALEMAHRFIILETDTELTEWTRRCLRTADRILLLAQATDSPEPGPLERQIHEFYGEKLVASKELVLLQPNRSHRLTGTRAWLERRDVRRHHHVCLAIQADMERLARFTAGRATGLVLGGGGARGMVHIGTLRALEEAGIQIDSIGGTSFGAIVGATAALEWGWPKILDRMKDFAARARFYFRYTLPIISFMDGHRLNEFFRGFFDCDYIEDLWVDYFCVASNMSVGNEVVLNTGSLWRSVRASMSLPGIFPPVPMNGNLLVDGALLSNLPVHHMRARLSNGTVIASYLNSEDRSPRRYNYPDNISPWSLLRSRLNPFRETVAVPTVFDTITRSIGLSNRWTIPSQKAAASLLIEHSVSQYGLFQYEAVDEIVEHGYQTARRAIEVWQADNA